MQKDICKKAIEVKKKIKEINDKEFKASNGWFMRFKKRWQLSQRQSTHSITDLTLTTKVFDDIRTLFKEIREYRINCAIENKKLIFINIDEVPIFFDTTGKSTLEFRGRQNIETIKSKGQYIRVTLLAGLTSNGVFLPPIFIFKTEQKSQLNNNQKTECIISQNSKDWSNAELQRIYLQSVVSNILTHGNKQLILVHDKFSGHSSKDIEQLLAESKIKVYTLPAGSTGYIQPVDTSISKKLKMYIRSQQSTFISKQLEDNKQSITSAKYQNIFDWKIDGFESFTEKEIKNSFIFC